MAFGSTEARQADSITTAFDKIVALTQFSNQIVPQPYLRVMSIVVEIRSTSNMVLFQKHVWKK